MTTAEIAEFRDSPYFNDRRVRKEIVLLFEYIAQYHPACDNAGLSKQAAHQYLFNDKSFGENRLNHVMTALQRLVESYLVSKFSNGFDETGQLFSLARFYLDRNLANRFEVSTSRLQEMLVHEKQEDQHLLWQKYQLEYLKHLQSGSYHQRSIDLNLMPVLDNLDVFYIAQRLILSAGLLTQNLFAQVDTSRTTVIYELLAEQEKYAVFMKSSPLIRAYYELLPLLTQKADLQYVTEYRDRLESMSGFLPKMHLKSLYTAIRNYLASKYNEGQNDMLPLLFASLKSEYEQGFLCEPNGSYRASTVQSVVTTGLKLHHFEWTRAFIENCRHRIIGTSKPEIVLIFIEANYFFHTKDYESAFETGFHQLKYDNFLYSLAARRLEVMIWYEKDDLNMSEYRLNALKSYLFANKGNIPEQMKLNNDHFVDIMRQLMSARNRSNPRRLTALKEKIIRERKSIAEREWLLGKLPG